jgi:hypothetical protein
LTGDVEGGLKEVQSGHFWGALEVAGERQICSVSGGQHGISF